MKTYKLLRDMPTVKAGTTFREITREVDGSKILKEYKSSNKVSILVSEVNDFDEWFEKIEPTDSSNWEPKVDERYFYVNEYGDVEYETWDDDDVDNRLMAMGLVYRTEEECEEARERRLAKVRLQRTSDFKPDPNKGELGWIVGYSCRAKKLAVERFMYSHYGETIHFKTAEDAKKSIRENEQDWKIYFGIKEEIK